MPKPFRTFVALLVLLNVVRAQSSPHARAAREQHGNSLTGPVLINPLGSPAVRDSTRAGLAESDFSRGMLAGANAGLVSVTSLAAPPAARKAYQSASREMGKKKPDLRKAAGQLETAVGLYPSFAAAWFFLGGIHLLLKNVDSASGAFETALAADPKFPYPYLPLAAIELRARRYAEAARLADSVLKLDYRLMQAHYYRALANSMLQRHDKARQSIQEIVDSGNDRQYPGVHAMLAVILFGEGDCEAAANAYSTFLDLDPDSPVAAEARDYLAKWRTNPQSAGERQGLNCR